jgi:hypothetical protein
VALEDDGCDRRLVDAEGLGCGADTEGEGEPEGESDGDALCCCCCWSLARRFRRICSQNSSVSVHLSSWTQTTRTWSASFFGWSLIVPREEKRRRARQTRAPGRSSDFSRVQASLRVDSRQTDTRKGRDGSSSSSSSELVIILRSTWPLCRSRHRISYIHSTLHQNCIPQPIRPEL